MNTTNSATPEAGASDEAKALKAQIESVFADEIVGEITQTESSNQMLALIQAALSARDACLRVDLAESEHQSISDIEKQQDLEEDVVDLIIEAMEYDKTRHGVAQLIIERVKGGRP